jgi:hypothetical protein
MRASLQTGKLWRRRRPCLSGLRADGDSHEVRRSFEIVEAHRRFLLDARSNLSEAAEAQCSDEIREFENRLGELNIIIHEFEKARAGRQGILGARFSLPFDMLEAAYDKSGVEGLRVLELTALAAASMGLYERQRRYDDRISKARGWKYEIVHPK